MSGVPVSLWRAGAALVLASASQTRAAMLRRAGIAIEIDAASIDERAMDDRMRRAGFLPADRALALARAKALAVTARHKGRIVLGADQTLEADGHAGIKARNRDEARAFLQALSGRRHMLHSAAVVARDGIVLFETIGSAALVMRSLSPAFLDAYLDEAGDAALDSVGGYRIEDQGIQLFESVTGDQSVILGLPLLPVLDWLRRAGALVA